MERQIVIQVENLSYTYPGRSAPALRGVGFGIHAGERVAILGANGSGKSTLLACLNGLVVPEKEGALITIYAEDGRALHPVRKEHLGEIRRRVGTVMQNLDDQIVSSVVEEDVAFGPENLGLTNDETKNRVEFSLKRCGLETLAKRSVRFLSGGEKQRLVLAGVLALETSVIALDEAVSMIDPAGREDFLSLLDTLNVEGKTILQVTHSLEEAFRCGRCLVLCGGELVFDGTPGDLLERPDLESWGFVLSEPFAAIRLFSEKLPGFSVSTLDPGEAAEKIAACVAGGKTPVSPPGHALPGPGPYNPDGPDTAAICCVHASHVYRDDGAPAGAENPRALRNPRTLKNPHGLKNPHITETVRGMKNVTFALPAGKSLALIGTSGSGKSTLLKHVNALLLPDRGRVTVLGKDTLDKKNKLAGLRMQAALSVQSPESALFEEYVADDVAFGPANAGLSGKALKGRVKEAMEEAGLPFADFADRKTFSLSGGEKRRTAIAGTVAMDSPVLLFDEPLAGLDGVQRRRILSMIGKLKSRGKTVVITTHSMECAASFDLVAVMSGGTMAAFGPPREIFGPRWDPGWGLPLPWSAAAARRLALPGPPPLNAAELADMVFRGPAAGLPAASADFPPGAALPAGPVPAARPGFQPAGQPDCGPGKNRRRKTGTEFFHTAGLGHFRDRPSALRFLSGRIKLPLLISAMTAAIALPPPFFPAALLVFILTAGMAAGRVTPGYLLRGFVSLAPWLFVMAMIQQLYTSPGNGTLAAAGIPDDTVVLSFWKISVTAASLLRSAFLFVRVASLTALFSLYSAVTPLRETLEAFNAGLSVFAPLGFPSRDISLGAGIALRFVPVLAEEAERIVTAQLSRGGKKGRLGMMISMIAPLFLRSLERSEKLAKAIALRLYGYNDT
ncbi:MAG: ATP-binding cassette domain-containing protein [Treponema sp.]|nr:ATP-binding cassette domain-containing protein [Treponema sp.]